MENQTPFESFFSNWSALQSEILKQWADNKGVGSATSLGDKYLNNLQSTQDQANVLMASQIQSFQEFTEHAQQFCTDTKHMDNYFVFVKRVIDDGLIFQKKCLEPWISSSNPLDQYSSKSYWQNGVASFLFNPFMYMTDSMRDAMRAYEEAFNQMVSEQQSLLDQMVNASGSKNKLDVGAGNTDEQAANVAH